MLRAGIFPGMFSAACLWTKATLYVKTHAMGASLPPNEGGGELPQEHLLPELVKRGAAACPLEAMQAWEMVI